MSVKELYYKYRKQGLPAKEAAKMVQKTTGLSAVTGKPLKQKKFPQQEKTEYRGQYGS